MAEFNNSAMTRWGNMAAAQALAGKKLVFTRIAFGDGYVPDTTSPEEMTDLVHTCASFAVTRVKVHPENTATIGGTYINDELEHGYWWREVGLFAIMPETGEAILFSYANAGEYAEWIPASDGTTVFEKRMDLFVYVGSKASVELKVLPDSFITTEQLTEELDAVWKVLTFMENGPFLEAIGMGGGTSGDGIGQPTYLPDEPFLSLLGMLGENTSSNLQATIPGKPE